MYTGKLLNQINDLEKLNKNNDLGESTPKPLEDKAFWHMAS